MFHYGDSFLYLLNRNHIQEYFQFKNISLNYASKDYVHIWQEDHARDNHHIKLVIQLNFLVIFNCLCKSFYFLRPESTTDSLFNEIFCASNSKKEFYNVVLLIFMQFKMHNEEFLQPKFCHRNP